MGLNIKSSTANPVATDIGNKEIQERVVSRTIQLALFTTNRNAVWGGRQQLRKGSYPLANIAFPANRNVFRLEVGDPFRFSCEQYGIVEMICRVAQISEDGPESENITVQAIQDVYSISNAITTYHIPTDHAIPTPDYIETALVNQRVMETPYVLAGEAISVLAFAARVNDNEIGFHLYMSSDGGASYSFVQTLNNLTPYGTLNTAYPADTYAIDPEGILIDFTQDEEDVITSTWPDVLAGIVNLAILGDEIISFLTVTPVTATQFRLENVVRGRYGTVRSAHAPGEKLYVITDTLETVSHPELVNGAAKKFKLVPYNPIQSGDIADATAIDLTLEAVAFTPYIPSNFVANGSSAYARYDTDIVLGWSARYRGKGAGIGLPGQVLPETDHEGLYTIEVYVDPAPIPVRTVTAINVLTWTYTEAMNLADNGMLASEVRFKIANYRVDGSTTYTSDQAEVTCIKN